MRRNGAEGQRLLAGSAEVRRVDASGLSKAEPDFGARVCIRFSEGAECPVPFAFPLTKKWSAGRRQGFARPLMTNLCERFVRVPQRERIASPSREARASRNRWGCEAHRADAAPPGAPPAVPRGHGVRPRHSSLRVMSGEGRKILRIEKIGIKSRQFIQVDIICG